MTHPSTPNPYEEMSKRAFDGCIKAWRRELHKWDVMDDIALVMQVPAHTSTNSNSSTNSNANGNCVDASGGSEGGKKAQYTKKGVGIKCFIAPVSSTLVRVPTSGATSDAKDGNSSSTSLGSVNTTTTAVSSKKNSSSKSASHVEGAYIGAKGFAVGGVGDPALAQLDSPLASKHTSARAAELAELGEDVAAIDGVDYDCEAPDYGSDEDVL